MIMMFSSLLLLAIALCVSTTTAQRLGSSLSETSCNKAPDQATCAQTADSETGLPCEWCLAGAIPSECMSQEQAQQLPPGVFDCSIPSKKQKQFQFAQGPTLLNLNVKEMEGDDNFCDPASKSISGYMDIKGSTYDQEGEDKHLFFWMFEKRNIRADENPTKIPFIVWLTGGPGCSSTLALLTENGPCSVNPDGKTTSVNEYAWTEAAHVLWLDQPAGVGFSYGQETDTNEAMVAEDAFWFFQALFQTYPEYSHNPLYIVGESYAGHYVPSISHRIYQGNQHPASDTIPLNFAGLAIGNGLTNPELQYPSYPEMVWNNSHAIKVVDESTYQAMKAAVPRCTSLIRKCNAGDGMINQFACQSAFLVCNLALTSPYQMTGLNPYDIRKQCEVPPLCYDFSAVSDFLNLESTKRALHVDEKHSHAWESCNYGINMKFHAVRTLLALLLGMVVRNSHVCTLFLDLQQDFMKDFSGYVAELLDAGFPALIYTGDVDFICNYIGNRK